MSNGATTLDLNALPEALAQETRTMLARLAGDGAVPTDSLEALSDRLNQANAYGPLFEVASRALERAHKDEAQGDDEALDRLPAKVLRFLVKSAEALGDKEQLFDALASAHGALPKDATLAMRYAEALEARGDHEEALEVTGTALDALLKSSDHSALDAILIKLLEARDPARLAVALPTIGALARRGEFARVLPFLELAGPLLGDPAVSDVAWGELSRVAKELGPKAEPLRGALGPIAVARLGAFGPALLDASGLGAGGTAPIAEAVTKLDDLALRAPGTYQDHGSWGVGKVTLLTADSVTLDFPKRPGQKMTLAAAKSALKPLTPDDPRVLAAWEPKELERLRKEDPAALVVGLLKTLKREAKVTEIKKLLVAWNAVPSASWTSYWTTTKKRLADDPRVDATHAFEQVYTLAREGQVVRLPDFPRHEAPRKALALLRRLLGQHAGARATLARTWTEGLLRWSDQERLVDSERIAALAWAAELAPDPAELMGRGVSLLAHAFTRSFDFASLPGTMEQRRALDWSLRGPSWEEAARSALSSRLTDLREAAFHAIDERHGSDAPAFWEALWLDAPNWPTATVTSLEHAAPAYSPPASLGAANPWMAVRGLVNLLESTPEDALAARATALLKPDGWLADACRARRAEEDLETLLTRRCLTWKTTERYLAPVIEFAGATGLDTLVRRVAEFRKSRLKIKGKGGAKADVAQGYTGRNFMSRRAYERTRTELEALEASLKTTIPAAIQKARELGDLRENAEYHSAKLKQSQAEARVLQLAERLREVTLIDETPPEPGVAGPGTEVTVRVSANEEITVWILGDGDGDFGSNVVSYRAPVGLALLGHRVGDTVAWTGDGAEIAGTIARVVSRSPA
jgi:transcription elongation factor GreA